jgi:hypothetical protein
MNSLKNCSGKRKALTGPENSLLKRSLFIIIPAILFSCGNASYEKYKKEEAAVADKVAEYAKGINTDTINGIAHNFLRTADIKFKVKNVIQSTTSIERLVRSAGGFIEKSDLTSNKDYTNSVRFKKDSLVEQTFYTSMGRLTLRVPGKDLDSVLSEITAMAVFVDHRNLGSDDVKHQLFANKLAEDRFTEYKERVNKKTDKSNAKLHQVTDAEENALQKQTKADNKRIDSYELIDKVNYSTLTLEIYQDQQVMAHVSPRPYSIEPYAPSFFEKLGTSFVSGFELLKSLILFFANIWSVLLVLALLFLGIKKMIVYYTKKTTVVSHS